MAYEVPQPEDEERAPAIILYGDAIQGMDEARRQEVAASLEVLLGVKAIARDVSVEYLGNSNDAESAPGVDEPSEPLPPFTLLFAHAAPGLLPNVDGHIELANARAPGVIENDVIAKRAMSFVASRAYRPSPTTHSWPFTYHGAHDESKRRPLRAITFDDPQALIDQPERVQESIRGLGPKTVEALAQFATAITRVQPRSDRF